eukprot:g9183.t1
MSLGPKKNSALAALLCRNGGIPIESNVCVCPEDFYGPTCEFPRCPNDCSGPDHGVCEKTTGKCACKENYAGESCATQVGRSALSGLASRALVLKNPAEVDGKKKKRLLVHDHPTRQCPDDCHNNGSCDAESGSCTCFPGYSGDSCGDYCPNECTGRGHCVNGASFRGADCSVRIQCSDHGVENDDGSCFCDEGWWGADCSVEAVCQDPTCSGHGSCLKGFCHCAAGFSGVLCDVPPTECDPACTQPGTISTEADPNAGKCGDNGEWNAAVAACDCRVGFHGERCELLRCAGFDEKEGMDDCHDNGLCINGECHCFDGFGMDPAKDKDEKVDPEVSLMQLSKVNSCRDRVCPIDCGKHGTCVEGACQCDPGFQGIGCREPSCQEAGGGNCSGQGVCAFLSTGQSGCICDAGFAGDGCEKTAITSGECENDCSAAGLCLEGKCLCKDGFFGSDCSGKQCGLGQLGPDCNLTQCANDCSGKGLCFNGKCSCWKEFAGPDCSVPRACYGACYKACDANSGSYAGKEKCEFCKGQCLTLSDNPQQRHRSNLVPPFLYFADGNAGPYAYDDSSRGETPTTEQDGRMKSSLPLYPSSANHQNAPQESRTREPSHSNAGLVLLFRNHFAKRMRNSSFLHGYEQTFGLSNSWEGVDFERFQSGCKKIQFPSSIVRKTWTAFHQGKQESAATRAQQRLQQDEAGADKLPESETEATGTDVDQEADPAQLSGRRNKSGVVVNKHLFLSDFAPKLHAMHREFAERLLRSTAEYDVFLKWCSAIKWDRAAPLQKHVVFSEIEHRLKTKTTVASVSEEQKALYSYLGLAVDATQLDHCFPPRPPRSPLRRNMQQSRRFVGRSDAPIAIGIAREHAQSRGGCRWSGS